MRGQPQPGVLANRRVLRRPSRDFFDILDCRGKLQVVARISLPQFGCLYNIREIQEPQDWPVLDLRVRSGSRVGLRV
eukprot:11187222-Lingulodinium_polyedra.AAC.1